MATTKKKSAPSPSARVLSHRTLYTLDSTGKIRLWNMETSGAKFRTISGIKGVLTSFVTSDWSTAEGKNLGRANETTPAEQAIKEVESRYKKQLKTGYHETEEAAHGGTSYVEPMLAKNFNDYAKKIDLSKGRYALQTKFNGIRMIATKDGLFTRKGERFISVPHIEKALQPFFVKYPNAVLDGECFNEDYRQQLNQIVHLARKTKNVSPADFAESEKLIRFYVYDGYGFSSKLGESAPYELRKMWIDANVADGHTYKYVVQVATDVVESMEDLNALYSEIVEDGHEGGILRSLDAPYEHKRSANLLKLKPCNSEDFYVTNVQPGVGNWAGKAKIISLRSEDGKLTFDATFKGTMEHAIECLRNKREWIGKLVEIQYNGLTGLGTPSFAQFDYCNAVKGDR